MLAQFRPRCPIIAVTRDPQTARLVGERSFSCSILCSYIVTVAIIFLLSLSLCPLPSLPSFSLSLSLHPLLLSLSLPPPSLPPTPSLPFSPALPSSQCHLHRGVHPFHYTNPPAKDWTDDADQRFWAAIGKGKKEGYIVKGSTVVLLSGWKPGPAHINTIRIFQVD